MTTAVIGTGVLGSAVARRLAAGGEPACDRRTQDAGTDDGGGHDSAAVVFAGQWAGTQSPSTLVVCPTSIR